MKPLVIFGIGAAAELARYYFDRDSAYSVVAFTVDASYITEPTFRGLPVIPFEELEASFPPDQATLFVAMGIQKVNQLRAVKVAEAEGRGYQLASYLSSRAYVADDFVLQPNSFIMEGVTMEPEVIVGRDTLIGPKSFIGIRTRVGDHCWLVAVTIGENVRIGDSCFIGLNSTIAPHLTIGASNVIGAGALILADTKEFSVFKGQASERSRVPSHRLLRI
jgi:sugar O-acyltransferase (sialic acid O-acetyltransferase NeuD family)